MGGPSSKMETVLPVTRFVDLIICVLEWPLEGQLFVNQSVRLGNTSHVYRMRWEVYPRVWVLVTYRLDDRNINPPRWIIKYVRYSLKYFKKYFRSYLPGWAWPEPWSGQPDLGHDSIFGDIRVIAWESGRWKHKPKTQHAVPLQCILYWEIVRKVKRHGKKATHGKEARLTFRTISQCKIHWRGPHVAFAVCSFSDDFLKL